MNRGTATPRRNTPYMSRDIIPRLVAPERQRPSLSPAAFVATSSERVNRAAMPDREEVEVAVQQRKEVPRPAKPRRLGIFTRYGIPGIAGFFIIAGAVLIYMAYTNNIQVSEQVKAYNSSAADSGEKTPTSGTSGTNQTNSSDSSGGTAIQLTTDPTKPRNLAIPSLGVNAAATEVGLNSKNEIGTPASIRNVSWYNGSSPLLDKEGTSVIVGHRGTDRYNGVFYKLDQLKAGAAVVATMGDGKTITYKVEGSETVPSNQLEMSKYLSYLGNTTRVLYLITCEGDYNDTTHSYPARVIVKAVGAD